MIETKLSLDHIGQSCALHSQVTVCDAMQILRLLWKHERLREHEPLIMGVY